MATYDLTSSIPSSSSLKTGDILNCPYSGTYKSITLPKGTYKLECWGAQGGSSSYHNTTGGKGGYSTGVYTITNNTTLYLYTGGMGNTGSVSVYGGYNGGGGVTSDYNYGGTDNHLGTGGGASDISLVGGECSLDSYYRYVRTTDSYNNRIIVAGGGGGSEGVGGTAGGGTSGVGAYAGTSSSAGSAIIGNASLWVTLYAGGFGYGASTTGGHTNHAMGCCGGGGWYGGGTYADNGNAAYGCGGSGYVNTSKLTSASTTAGNSSFTSPTGSTEIGHSGNGYIKITVQSIMNWAYSTTSISAPTYNKQNTSSWTLTPSTCRYFSFTPTISGDFIVYSNSSIDTYGYLTSSITSLNSSGQPSSNILSSDDDYAKKYGGSGGNFGICYKVTAGTTYHIFVKPYSDSTANSSVYLTYYMAHPDSRVYVKINNTTWKLITN